MTGRHLTSSFIEKIATHRLQFSLAIVVLLLAVIGAGVIWYYLNVGPLITKRGNATITTFSPRQLQQQYPDPFKTIQTGDTAKAWAANNFIILDIRPRSEYLEQHIKGSISAPLSQLADGLIITSDTMVIFSPHQSDIDKAITILHNKGVNQLYVLRSSLTNLERSNYVLESYQ